MRKYYLFKIKNKSNNKKIYLVFEELFNLNSNKFKYGISIFNNVCLKIDKKNIIDKLRNTYNLKDNKIFINDLENTIVEINNTCIAIKSSKNIPKIFKIINLLESNILVCDFDSKDYFWLDDFIKLNFKLY